MNYLIIWKDFKIFYGSHSRTVDEHSHPVIQLVFAIRGTFRSKDDSGDWAAKKGLLIAPNCPHECDASDVPIISIQIDPESSLGEWILSNQLKGRSIIDYPAKDIGAIDINRFSSHLVHEDWPAIREMVETAFGFRSATPLFHKDKRIQDVVAFISNHIGQKINSETLAEVACLSESRLLHLFKAEMGPITDSEDMLLVPTAGHTKHHASVLFKTDDFDILFAGDVSYNQEQLIQGDIPGINADYKKTRRTYDNITAYAQQNRLIFLPSHDWEAALRLEERSFLC